jgi:DNA-directed RNA polymerase subunit omega
VSRPLSALDSAEKRLTRVGKRHLAVAAIRPARKEKRMARITVEDCLQKINNRFLIVQMAIKRVRQYREGYTPLVECKNKEVVTALREIAAGEVLPSESIEEAGIHVEP